MALTRRTAHTLVGGLLAALTLFVAAPISRAGAGIDPGVPRYEHVFTIVLENENYASSWDGPDDTYLHRLRSAGAFAQQYYGVSHVSADNYIAMTSGQAATPPFNGDCLVYTACEGEEHAWPDGGRSVADQVEESHQTWKAYMESMPGPCTHPGPTQVPDPYQNGYATRHNPFVYYPPIVEDQRRCESHVVPFTQLTMDLAKERTTPSYVFITPDTCHDGHDAPCSAPPAEAGQPGGLASANAFLAEQVPRILQSPAWKAGRSLLIVTFDENGFTDAAGCCAPPTLGGRVGLVAIDSAHRIAPGTVTCTQYNHWSYLRTVEDALGIGEHLNVAGTSVVHPMTDLFAARHRNAEPAASCNS